MEGLRQECWSTVTKGEKSASRGKWENAIGGKQTDSVQEETLAVSATDPIVDRKHNRPLLLQKRGHRPEENPRNVLVSETTVRKERSESVQNVPQRILYGSVV